MAALMVHRPLRALQFRQWALAFSLVFCAPFNPESARANLLLNGDFNLAAAGGGPTNWSTWSLPAWNNAWVNRQRDGNSLDGTYYMAVGNGNGKEYSEGLSQVVSIVPGQAYRLAVNSGAQSWWRPEGEIRLLFLNATNGLASQTHLVTVDPNKIGWDTGKTWSRYALVGVAPTNAVWARVELVMNGGAIAGWGGGTVWFDNADLSPEPTNNFLRAAGVDIVDQNQQPVYLRGVNLGGWLFFESWMCPATMGTNAFWQEEVETNLISRFGIATKDALVEVYQSNWITSVDLDLVASAGMNLVRVPFTYSVFQEQPQAPSVPLSQVPWKSDAAAFKYLDWLVEQCARRGIYVVFDFHHPEGGASSEGLYKYAGYQDRFVEIWRRIAARYVGNSTVFGYDLVNESGGATNLDAVWNRAYQAIRAVDLDHAIIAEYWSIAGTAQKMDAYGWQNVVASMHDYWDDGNTVSNELAAARAAAPGTTVCPYYVGEFMDNTDSTPRLRYYSDSGASWCSWTLKTVNQMDWSLLNASANGANSATDIPNLNTDSAAQISAKWAKWSTRSPATRYQPTCNRLSSPIANADVFRVRTNGTLLLTSQALLTNDTDLSQICQLTVTNLPARTAHGTLTAVTNGFFYQQDPGFKGTDSFTYRALDQRLHLPSALAATVTLNSPVPSAPAALRAVAGLGQVALIWSNSPDAAGYNLRRAAVSGGPYTIVASNLMGTNFTDNVATTHGSPVYYVVTGTNSYGESAPSIEASAAPLDQVRYPLADAFVRSGSYANNNFGTNLTLDLKNDPNPDFNREGFVRFDVSGLTNARSVQLSLMPVTVGSPTISAALELVPDDAWTETGLTWNIKPASSGVSLTNFTGFVIGTASLVDVTAPTLSEAAGNGRLSLRLRLNSASVNLSVGAREQAALAARPQLWVTLNPDPFVLVAQMTATNTMVLSWPTDYSGCHLWVQTNAPGTGLSTNWMDAGVVSSNPLVLSVPPGSQSVFYRLRAP